MQTPYAVNRWKIGALEVILLPVFSLSNSDKSTIQRLVFDWGKGLSHPHASPAFAISRKGSSRISRIIFKGYSFNVLNILGCRSGRLAAYVQKTGPASYSDNKLIDTAMALM